MDQHNYWTTLGILQLTTHKHIYKQWSQFSDSTCLAETGLTSVCLCPTALLTADWDMGIILFSDTITIERETNIYIKTTYYVFSLLLVIVVKRWIRFRRFGISLPIRQTEINILLFNPSLHSLSVRSVTRRTVCSGLKRTFTQWLKYWSHTTITLTFWLFLKPKTRFISLRQVI